MNTKPCFASFPERVFMFASGRRLVVGSGLALVEPVATVAQRAQAEATTPTCLGWYGAG